MGPKESKLSFLPYEEALKRVSQSELDRLKNAFKRHSGNSNLLPKTSFFNEILGDVVPVRLSEQLYMTCGGASKGIAFRDVIVILTLITKGTIDEKVRFLFCLMSVDGNGITREDLENFYMACDGGQIMPRCVSEAFWRHDKLSYEAFYQWVVRNPDFSAITRWLLEEQRDNHGIKLSCDNNTPTFYHSLANITKLSEADIIELEKHYWAMKAFSKTGRFDKETFTLHVCPPLPTQFCDSFFIFFDKNHDDHIDFKEMVSAISICCRGFTYERLTACFHMFDLNSDGILSNEELTIMANGLLEIYNQYENSDLNENSIEKILAELPSEDGIDLNDFRSWASTSKLIHEFLLLLSQICHIVFGLKPAIREEEGVMIRRWLDREHKNGLQPGLLYYLITMNWWKTWKLYVNYENVSNKNASVAGALWRSELKSDNANQVDVISEDKTAKVNNISDKQNLQHNTDSDTVTNGDVTRHKTTKVIGSIDNSILLGPADPRKLTVLTGEGGKLTQNIVLMYGRDYEVLPEPVWKALFNWYGANVALPRTVIVDNEDSEPTVELYPVQIYLYRHTQPPKSNGLFLNSFGINNLMAQIFGNAAVGTTTSYEPPHLVPPKRTLQYRASFSRKNTIRQILDFLSSRLKINSDDLRIWKMENQTDIQLLEEDQKTVEEESLKEGDNLLIEVRNRDLSWPEEMNSLVATRNFRERSSTGLLEKGATGLHNLGNTCFMNSAVQCLSNTKPLRKYFSSNIFLYELNKTNPLGMKGILAKRYGDLISDLWSGFYRSIAPVKLRWTIGRYAPRFNGFQQHDSQELLSFLLDGLHEDINRVHEKPYVELNDSDGRPDREVANEAWENHVKRNQSIIVDLFQGQLKSQVRCLHCGHVSVRFDPFTFLSLPLPLDSSFHLEIPVFTLNGKQTIKYGLLLSQDSTIKNLRKKLSSICGLPLNKLMLVEVVAANIRTFLTDDVKLKTNLVGYIYGYEINSSIDITPISNGSSSRHCSPMVRSPNESQSNDSASSSSSLICTTIGSADKLSVVKTSNSESEMNNSSKSKNKRHFKKAFRPNRSSTKIVDVTPRTDIVAPLQSDSTSLEIPGIVNQSLSPNHSCSSVEMVCETTHHGLVVAMNRKMILSTNYFLSWQKFRPVLFGIPILLSCLNETSNRDIYETIWQQVSKYVAGSVCDDKKNRTYPFKVKAVDKEGNYCVWCPWYRFCRGCPIQCDDDCFGYTSSYLAVDWDPTVLHLQYQQSLEKNFLEHDSIAESCKLLREPISLDKCLKDFTKEEELGEKETWYCCKCKEHRTIAKKFDIWKLPPILVIHLKRFQLVNNRWIKSNKLVKFPSKSFDPSTYLVKTDTCHQDTMQTSEEQSITNLTKRISKGITTVTDGGCVPVDSPITDVPLTNGHSKNSLCDNDISVETTSTCISVNEHSAEKTTPLYDLYAISCHYGMLNGGHYVTYAKNENRKWYCYNDSSCKEVDASLINQESPYMLFYERKNLDTMSYMPNIKDKQPANVQQEEDEFDKEVKKYCSIM